MLVLKSLVVIMSSESELISELSAAKENIRRKYIALKQGDADTSSFVSQTFKPIIEPLKDIQKSSSSYFQHQDALPVFQRQKRTPVARVKIVPDSLNSTRVKDEKEEEEEEEDGEDGEVDVSAVDDEIDDWYHSQTRDRTYGPKILAGGVRNLGRYALNFGENYIIIGDIIYPRTRGVIELIFSRNPLVYDQKDLNTYKKILEQTSAHLTVDGTKIKKSSGNKYSNIIARLFSSGGGGLSMKL